MDKTETISFRRRNLPHWRVAGRPYFVTFRLKGSIPPAAAIAMQQERERFLQANPDDTQAVEMQRIWFRRLEKMLDRAEDGPLHLRNPQIADAVMAGFEWLEKECGWNVPAAVVMPNHVHCLMIGKDETRLPLDRSLAILKGRTARQANLVLGKTGEPFWAPESFDHWCRNPGKTESVVEYIRNNPAKAGLVASREEWPWMK